MATFLGMLLALSWPVGLAACATWLAVAVMFRYSSLAALAASALSVLWAVLIGRFDLILLIVVLAALVYFRHQGNIGRLLAGTEPRIGKKG